MLIEYVRINTLQTTDLELVGGPGVISQGFVDEITPI